MAREPGPTDPNRISEPPCAPVFLGGLSECDRRRVVIGPAPELLDSRMVGHLQPYGRMVIDCVVVPVRPLESVIVSRTT
jgi:hypothetical protein